MIKKIFSEEIIVVLLIFGALFLAFTPFLYEIRRTSCCLAEDRYPLFESDFAPDLRVHLSRMQQGFEGKWLVKEKYTAETHRPSILHEGYLLMGKITGWLGLAPIQALPVWRLISGVLMLVSGYFFILCFLEQKSRRLVAFLIFVLVGNWPIISSTGITLAGLKISFFLGWFTFYDPVKRLIFLPHYTLAAAFLSLALALFWQKRFFRAGILAFLTSLVLPHNLLVLGLTAFILILISGRIKELTLRSWPFWLLTGLGLILIKFSLSYFPWSVQSLADAGKRGYLKFDYRGVLLGLGPTGILGLLGIGWIFYRREKCGYPAAAWLISVITWILIFTVFPISHPYRFTQTDLHLPLAVLAVFLFKDIAKRWRRRPNLIFWGLVILVLLPSFLVWPASLKAQKMFVDAKIAAAWPLIPQVPYVVYPVRPVMEAIFWLRQQTDHEAVVLSAETLGSMIPAYAGNTVYLGHGNQTVYFESKMKQMQDFYSRRMNINQMKQFLSQNRISWVFYGPEEAGMGKIADLSFLKPAVSFGDVVIYRYDGE